MLKVKAEVEDDDDFGEFKFISTRSFPSQHPPNPIATDDDDWGDFIENPLQFHPQTPPNPRPLDLFSDFKVAVSDLPANASSASISVGFESMTPDSAKKKWEKPQGALPLSIFGEEEAEEPSAADLSFGIQDGSLLKQGFNTSKNGMNSIPGVSFNDIILNLYSRDEKISNDNGVEVNSEVADRDDNDLDASCWEFKDAYSEMEGKDSSFTKEWKVSEIWGTEAKEAMINKKIEDVAEKLEHHQGNMLSSTFINGKLGSDDEICTQDGAFHKAITSVSNNMNGFHFGSGSAFNDLLSNRYCQAQPISTVHSTRQPTENEVCSAQSVLNSSLVNPDDDLDKSGWEFMDAFSEGKFENGNPGFEVEDAGQSFSAEVKLKNFVDFYSRLKEESRFFILGHLDDIEKAKKVAAISGEELKVMALDEEIKAAYDKVREDNCDSGKVHPEEHSPINNICARELFEVVQDQRFQELDVECQLSKRISLAEKDLSSAVWLLEHAISMLRTLTLASVEEQSTYISTWSKMVSACAKELQHGAMVWKQAVQKNFHLQLFTDTRGLRYLLALGEIYRVAQVLRTSVALYRPWFFLRCKDDMDIFVHLLDCTTSWMDSGLKEFLERLSNSADFKNNRTVKALLQSIKSIHDLNEFSLHHHAIGQEEPICRLTLLPSGLLQGMLEIVQYCSAYSAMFPSPYLFCCYPLSTSPSFFQLIRVVYSNVFTTLYFVEGQISS